MRQKMIFLDVSGYKPLPDISVLKIASHGCDSICLSDPSTCEKILKNEKNIIAFVTNYPNSELFQHIATYQPIANIVFITDLTMSEYLKKLTQKEENFLNHIIANNSDSIWSIHELRITLQKILNKDFFGINKYLMPGAEIHHSIIEGTKARNLLCKEVANLSEKYRLGSYISKLLYGIVEELLMNAIYDAPRSVNKDKYGLISDSIAFELDKNDQSILSYGFDGKIFATAVADPFGTMPRDLFFSYLKKVVSRNDSSKLIDSKKEGAGLGLFKILYSSHALICNLNKNVKTEVISIIDTSQQVRDFAKAARSIHFFC